MATVRGHRDELDDLEHRLDELRRKYDLYFHGSPEQRRPPTQLHVGFGGTVRRIKEEAQKWNTGERFRLTQLYQRLVSYERMWSRTLQQIEDGVYKRDRFKAARRRKEELMQQGQDGVAAPANAEDDEPAQESNSAFSATNLRGKALTDEARTVDPEETGRVPRLPITQVVGSPEPSDGFDVDFSADDDEVPPAKPAPKPVVNRPGAVPRPVNIAPTSAARPAGSGGGDMTEQRLKQLYDVYMQAKKRTGESTSLTMDALRQQIQKQVPAIKAKHNCNTVDFKVVLKDGKAMLKAIPK